MSDYHSMSCSGLSTSLTCPNKTVRANLLVGVQLCAVHLGFPYSKSK